MAVDVMDNSTSCLVHTTSLLLSVLQAKQSIRACTCLATDSLSSPDGFLHYKIPTVFTTPRSPIYEQFASSHSLSKHKGLCYAVRLWGENCCQKIVKQNNTCHL